MSDTPADIDAALACIPADDRDTWIKCGMAVKSELGDSGFDIWDRWSASAGNYNERAARDTWKSFRDGGIGIGTLIHLAQVYGYRRLGNKPRVRAQNSPPKRVRTENRTPSRTGQFALEIWSRVTTGTVASHPYAQAKGITWDAGAARATVSGRIVGQQADCIVVPVRDLETGNVVAVQAINGEGAKQTFGSLSGHGLVLGNTLDKSLYWAVCEGWASAVSLVFHHYSGNAVCAVAFGKSNLDKVAERLAELHQPDCIRIIRENDDKDN